MDYCCPHFAVLNIVGAYVILNLFLAILLGEFAHEAASEKAKANADALRAASNSMSPNKLMRMNSFIKVHAKKVSQEALEHMHQQVESWRKSVLRFTQHKYFDPAVLVLIAISSVLLAIDEPYLRRPLTVEGSVQSTCLTR